MWFKNFIFALACLRAVTLFGENRYGIEHALVSIYAVHSDTGEVLFDMNSDLSLSPGSCMKIATTGAALQLLEVDSRFETHLEYDGFIDDTKILHGNVYIRGNGDPCLGSDRASSALPWGEQIAVWADAIQKLGIQKIEGRIIGDATKWEKALAVPSWVWEDLGNYYGAGACALSFHENCYSLFFKPGEKVGEKACILRTDPPLPTHIIHNEVTTGPEGSGDCACIYGSEFSSMQFVRGTIPAAVNEFVIRGAIPDPATCCAALLTKKLQERGISLGEEEIAGHSARVLFHTTYSPKMGEIVYWSNQKSINLYAEHLLKKMGEVIYNEGSTASGIKAVTNFWRDQGIDLGGFNMFDGSGLSRKNLITTKQLVRMLLTIKKSDSFPIFFDSLPQIKGSIRAKSGSMSLIKGYVGYKGHCAFAILINQCADRKMINEKIDLFLSSLE